MLFVPIARWCMLTIGWFAPFGARGHVHVRHAVLLLSDWAALMPFLMAVLAIAADLDQGALLAHSILGDALISDNALFSCRLELRTGVWLLLGAVCSRHHLLLACLHLSYVTSFVVSAEAN